MFCEILNRKQEIITSSFVFRKAIFSREKVVNKFRTLFLTGNIYIFSGAKTYQHNIIQNHVVNVIPVKAWQRC